MAAVSRRVDAVNLTLVPPSAAFAIKVGGSASPLTLRALDDPVPIFDQQFRMSHVDKADTFDARELPGGGDCQRLVCFLGGGRPLADGPVPPDRTVKVDMGDRNLNRLELVLVTVCAPVVIVCGVQLKEGFECFGCRGFSLLDQGLLHLCKAVAEAVGVDEAHDRRCVDTYADFPQSLVRLNGGVLEKLLVLNWQISLDNSSEHGFEGVQLHS